MTIKKLAAHLGLSKSTVSRALNGYTDVSPTTRDAVLNAAKAMGYRPNATAKRLASGKAYQIGVLLPADSAYFVSPAFSRVLSGASDFLQQHGYQLIVSRLITSHDEIQKYRDFIDSGLVDGLFLVRTQYDDPRVTLLKKQQFPFVCHGYLEMLGKQHWVDVDNQDAFYQMTKRQIDFGHQRIAFLNGPKELTLSKARLVGYQGAIKEANLTFDPKLVLHGQLSQVNAMDMAKTLLSLAKRPSVILCADDTMAMGTIAACEDLGYQPGVDISIAGYGDYEHSAYSRPSITTLRYDTYQVGVSMAKQMLNQVAHMNFEVENWFQAQIISRDSDLFKPSYT